MERVGDDSSFRDKHELPVKVDLLCSRTAARPPAASGREGKGFKQLIQALYSPQALWVSPLLSLYPEMPTLCSVALLPHRTGTLPSWEHLPVPIPTVSGI